MGNAYSAVPYNAQINQINAELSCILNDPPLILNQPVAPGITNLTLSATSPLTGGSGQEIQYSDIAVDFIVPPFTFSNFYSTVEVDIAITLTSVNAAPSVATIRGSVTNPINDTSYKFTSPSLSYVLGAAGQDHSLQLGSVLVNFTLYRTDGREPVQEMLQCAQNTPQYFIGTTAVDDSSGPALTPSNNGNSVFPATPFGSKYSLANIPLNCVDNNGRAEAYNLTLAATTPLTLRPGDNFYYTDVVAFFTIPSDVVYALSSVYGPDHLGIISLTNLLLRINFNNATPADGVFGSPTFNPAASSDPEDPTPATYRYLVSDYRFDLPMPLPISGSVAFGPYSAGSSGSLLSADVQQIGAFPFGFTYLDNGTYLDARTYASCRSVELTRLFSIPVA